MTYHVFLVIIAPLVGFEPTTIGLEVRCSVQLSYRGIISEIQVCKSVNNIFLYCKKAIKVILHRFPWTYTFINLSAGKCS